jgi:predicted transcriptional regulator
MVKKQRTLKPRGDDKQMMGLHEEHRTLKAFTADQQSMRNMLIEIVYQNPQSFRLFADEIGIGYGTLHNFLASGKDVNFITLSKIRAFLIKYEKEKSKRITKEVDKEQQN